MVSRIRFTVSATAFPLHRPSELVYADVRRTAVRVANHVSYATDFVWDSLLPSALPIADPPPEHRSTRVSEIFRARWDSP